MTVWGPAVHPVGGRGGVPIYDSGRQALDAGYISVRTVIDERNRNLRGFWLARGMRP